MTKETDVLVIGSGPGGYVAAIRSAQLGKNVTIVEKDKIGGICLNEGCIPSKAFIVASERYENLKQSAFMGINSNEVSLNFQELKNWKDNQVVRPLTHGVEHLLNKNNVTILRGKASFVGINEVEIITDKGSEQLVFHQAVIATGSSPMEIPGFKFGGKIVDSSGGLNFRELPRKLVIVGGGYIGCELACVYSKLGTEVTIIEGNRHILPSFEEDISHLILNKITELGVKVYTQALAKQAKEEKGIVSIEFEVEGKKQVDTGDYVMVTVGRKANTQQLGLEKVPIPIAENGLIDVNEYYQTSQSHIYAIGDIVKGPTLAYKASYEAKVAAEVLAGGTMKKDYKVIPLICFTDPEVAVVGLTKSEAKKLGKDVEAIQFPFKANGRALSLSQTDGFTRLVYDKQSLRLIGAQIVGPHASELIGELTLAIEAYLTIEDIALTIHGHPTLSESIMDACEAGMKLPIHI